MKKHIPNLFTLGNLLCGCLACIFLLTYHGDCYRVKLSFEIPAFLVLLGAFLDFFDGFFARLLGVDGEFGKQLDSLADLITFGFAPSLIATRSLDFNVNGIPWYGYFGLLIVLMSAMRLAKFNISTDQTDSFIGLPTPANALFWIGLPFLTLEISNLVEMTENWNLIISVGLISISSYLLVSPLKLIALKFKSFGWKGNEARWVLIGLSIATLITLTTITGNVLASLPIIIILYIIISVINNSFSKNEL